MRTAGVRSVDDKDIRLKRGHKTKRASQSEARFLHAGLACWPARRDSNPRPSESESAAISSFATGGYQMICLFKATVILPRLPEKSNRSHQKIRKGHTPPMKETARRQNPASGPCHHCRTNTDLGCPQRGHCQVSGSFSKGSSPS